MDVELKETKAELKAYKAARKEHKAQTEAAREKISSVINALNQKKEALKEPRHDLPFHPSTRHFDSRRKKDFIKNIHSTPALTEDEQNMIGVYYFSRAAGSFLGQAIRVLVNVKMLVDEEGRRTFIVAFAPLNTYDGTHHEVSGEVENALLVN
ncbi:hypothetical protein TrLO_g5223 [Triparma laevis f. longispina]|uniref:Uncharacterized protein n=1 Tax=Triparma laevis f. longispina TaxID=1714387 RepID=A0A9W7A840_9STRA|nr:hypothetical protein TrLO_g5223 [Triparma laevis f. longispina]